MIRRAIADVSSICWTSLLAGKDKENGIKVEFDGKEVLVNSATFGYENAINYVTSALKQIQVQPINLILVVEGKNSKSMRQRMLEGYKDTRDSRPPEAYEQFNLLKERLVESLLAIGASAVTQDGLEADDVIAYLTQNLDGERYIISRDGDLLQLVGGDIHMLRNGEIDLNTYGPFPVKFVRLYKSLVGKPDESPGAYKFGEKAFLDLYSIFGDSGCHALETLIKLKKIKDLAEDVHELKSLQRIIDSEEMVYKSYAVSCLYPEKVNTMRMPLQWRVGMVKHVSEVSDERLEPYAGRARLVHAGNYEQAIVWAAPLIRKSAVVSLDIETSTPRASDVWLAEAKGMDVEDGSKDLGIDVFGSFLVSMSLTFGENNQYTLYFTHKHLETDKVKNLTSAQMRQAVEMVPKEIPLIIQNVSFELTVLYQEWCEAWKDNGWHGFLPNVLDTAIMSNYVNENRAKGLKDNSKLLLNYDQMTFDEVTQIEGPADQLPRGGRLVSQIMAEGPGAIQKRRYKMDELTAEHVFHYGCDDTICTIALHNHYRTVMELEKTWDVFIEVEQLPAYLTALAYVQGVPISMKRMLNLQSDDDATYNKAWGAVRQFLLDHKWEGTVRPEFVSAAEFETLYPDEDERKFLLTSKSDGKRLDVRHRSIACPAHIKEAVEMYSGVELESRASKPAALAGAILEQVPESSNFAEAVEKQDVATMNALIKTRFTGEPVLDLDSPKKMQRLLYDVIGIPPRLVNKLTPTEREKNKPLAEAMGKYNKILNGSSSAEMTQDDLDLIRVKAKTDAFALKWALKFDATPEQQEILNALQTMATVSTRRSLFYGPYRYVRHWKDNLIHANANQCGAVTRRYSFSKPNFQQLPRKGEGGKFRKVIVPHVKDGLVGSVDFSGQELRLMAGQSGDKNMMDCYVGDKLKDIHSITAAGAMEKKWSKEQRAAYAAAYADGLDKSDPDYEYDLFLRLRKSSDKAVAKAADDLRKDAKNVNFAAQFDAQPKKLSEMLTITLADATAFLEAKMARFPKVETWKEEVRENLMSKGFVTTMHGARRHLADAVQHENKYEAERAGRQGPNFKIQGSAGEMSKLAMARMWKSGVFCQEGVRFYFPVHDEVVWSSSRQKMPDVARIVNECMTEPYSTLPVPILGSISVGANFADQVECGDEFDMAEVIRVIENIPTSD